MPHKNERDAVASTSKHAAAKDDAFGRHAQARRSKRSAKGEAHNHEQLVAD